ncbi:uncharacterized protein JN550_001859 [Neoarthrinium moseri]|uniref:uncharacterized protein n=1 Tax=Neoarthrinium moseri TaxID=1658444 RepID=UPI001FDC0C69|nr:uncharacterized protein JN550_001859 [Neoarthrinium moseri]KAI1875573.1 hypothetical protein JN550_001859 [Neoarthrinium moseri]
MPDYRLRPEAEFADLIEDMRDFWTWVGTSLPQLPGIEVDVNNLAIVGESAGGTLTAQTALLGMINPIRVILMQYPALDIEGHLKWLESLPEDQKVSEAVLDQHLAGSISGHIFTRVPNGWRMNLAFSMMHNGRFADMAKQPYLDPMKSLESAPKMPPVFLFHGRQDTLVKVEGSETWAKKLRELQPDVPLHFVIRDGEHSLDEDDRLTTPWLQEPIEFVERFWPHRDGDI